MFKTLLTATTLACAVLAAPAAMAELAPDALVRQISVEVIDTARSDKAIQAGELGRILNLVETKVMPHVNFEVVTRSEMCIRDSARST